MQRNKTWKLATGLMVLILLATPLLAFVPAGVSAATGNKLSIIVYDDNTSSPVNGANVTLIGVHQQSAIAPKVTGSGGLAGFTPYDGYYKVIVSKSGYYTYQSSGVIRFADLSADTIYVPLMKISNVTHNLTVNVNGTYGALNAATVVVKITINGMSTSNSTVTTSGIATLELPDGTYSIVCSKADYATDVESNVVIDGADVTKNITLSAAVKYSGFVTVAGAPATNVSAYLVGTNPLVETDRKIIKASGTSPFFSFDAYVGNFTLIVDADSALASVENVTIGATNPVKTVALANQNVQTEENAFMFDANDWNVATLTKILVLDHDNTVPGLDFAFLPSAKMQIDLVFGNGDGNVNATELAAFVAEMEAFGPIDVTTVNMLSVGTQIFKSDVANPDYTITGLLGSVTNTNGFRVEMVAGYTTAIGTVTNDLASYSVKVTSQKTVADMNYTYKVAFPSLYENVGSAIISPSGSAVTVTGYTEVTVTSGTSLATATMTVHKSVAPTASAAVVTGTAAYKVLNGSTLKYYIVSSGINTTFTATGSSDPNGNPLSYTWKFGDASSATVTTLTTNHIYTVAKEVTVNLTVTDKAGMVAYKDFKVRVDNVAPVVVMTQNGTAVGSTLTVDQNRVVTFTSKDSYDRLNATADGLIARYSWVFGNGNAETILLGENQTVSNTWTTPGTFSMYLNVTDVANHTTSKAVTVTVLDTKAPVAKFVVKLNGTTVTAAKENQTLVFNCSASTDDSDIVDYFWDFGDGTNSTEQTPSHNFSGIATFKVKLVLTDDAGNKGYYNYSLKITTSARPDIRVNGVTFDPTKFTEGEKGTIYVNVTNVGTAQAQGLYVQLFKVNLDGDTVLLTDVGTLWVNDTEATYLNIGETGILRIEYSFDSKGDYTLQVNVTANKEVASVMNDNTSTVSLEVQEASWKAWLLYGGIFAVIIVVIVLFLFRKKLPMVSGKKAAPPTKKK